MFDLMSCQFSVSLNEYYAGCLQKTVFGGQPTKPDYVHIPCAVFWYWLFLYALFEVVLMFYMVVKLLVCKIIYSKLPYGFLVIIFKG